MLQVGETALEGYQPVSGLDGRFAGELGKLVLDLLRVSGTRYYSSFERRTLMTF